MMMKNSFSYTSSTPSNNAPPAQNSGFYGNKPQQSFGSSNGTQGSWGGGGGNFQSGWRAGGGGDKMSALGATLHDIKWTEADLTPFQKVFYKEGQSPYNHEEIEKFRKEEGIILKSHHKVPHPFITWEDTHFPPYIIDGIKQAGFTKPSQIQSQAFPIVLSGHDFIGIAQTGSGKTLAFLLPGIVHINAQPTVKKGDGPIVLVLAPTRELAMQIQGECDKFGKTSKLMSSCIYGGVDKYHQKVALQKGLDMIIATPGRLIDFLESGVTNLRRVTYLVLDEADRMLDMGFEPQIRKIVGQIRPDRQTLMFSATWPKSVRQLAHDFCKEQPIHIQIGDYDLAINSNIKQIVEVVKENAKTDRLVKTLFNMGRNDKVLVFCQTKRGCEKLFNTLSQEGFKVSPIHGDKTQRERDRAMELFRQGRIQILVATDVASRGIDVKDITYVINFDFPKQMEDYVHRIGRTGRAGEKGISISFLTADEDSKIAKELVEMLEDANQEVPEDLVELAGARRPYSANNFNSNYKKPYYSNYNRQPQFNSSGFEQQPQRNNYEERQGAFTGQPGFSRPQTTRPPYPQQQPATFSHTSTAGFAQQNNNGFQPQQQPQRDYTNRFQQQQQTMNNGGNQMQLEGERAPQPPQGRFFNSKKKEFPELGKSDGTN